MRERMAMRERMEGVRASRAGGVFLAAAGVLAAALAVAVPARAQRERPALHVTGYVIDAELDPATHHLTATAVVSFTPPANQDVANFGFHPALKLTKVTDDAGTVLTGDRSADGGIRITPAKPFVNSAHGPIRPVCK